MHKLSKIVVLLLVLFSGMSFIVTPAAASGTPTKVLVFTDKKTYSGWVYDTPKGATTLAPVQDLAANLRIIVYAIVIDDDGNIMTGRSITGSVNETQKLSPGGASGHHIVTNNPNVFGNYTLTFVDNGSILEDTANDGIYTAIADLNDTKGSPLTAEHFKMNISVSDAVAGKQYAEVLISGITCMNSPPTDHNGASQHVKQTASDNCAVCHHGYEHWYENKSGTFNDDQLDIHTFKTNGIDVTAGSAQNQIFNNYRWNYSDSGNNRATPDNWDAQVPGSKYCAMCHMNFTDPGAYTTVDNLFDYGSGTRNDATDIPSCSNSNCHINGKTLYENTQTPSWNPSAMGPVREGSNEIVINAKIHNQSTTVPARVACVVCHDTTHSFNLPNTTKNTTAKPINEQCWLCHNITGGLNITSSGGTNVAHSSNDCKSCHYDSAGKLDVHNVPKGISGGRNCTDCHDIGMDFAKVDVSKMNLSNSIHVNLNKNATLTAGVRVENKFCWGCHTNSTLSADNVVNEAELPATGHPDGYNTPKKCTDCHIQSKFGAFIVSEHYTASADINTKNYSNVNDSCINCHNKSEMIIPNNDPNGPISQYANVSHYGSNKTGASPYIIGGSANCTYCHNNTGTNNFTSEMVDPARNASIQNHTALATNPSCTSSACHNRGRIHDSTLLKPSVSTVLCTSSGCHTTSQKHNNSVDCVSCHLQTNRSIHPVQYFQSDKSWKQNSALNKTTAVNCTNCHQNATFWTGSPDAPIIPEPLKHSSNRSNGSLWNSTSIPYWNTEDGSCYYCHNNTKHNSSALGKIGNLLNSNNTKNGSLTTTQWCADCHYNASVNTNYKGDQWTQRPPTITVNNTGKNNWVNHSTYFNSGFKDSKCNSCHALNGTGTYSSTSLNYSHSLDEGSGTSCIDCHQNPVTGPSGTYPAVNINNFGKHNNVNTTGGQYLLTDDDCTTCHYNFDYNTMNQAGFGVPTKSCSDCHNNGSGVNAPVIDNHRPNGQSINTSATCSTCHNNSVNNSYTFSAEATVSHYATRTDLINSKDCMNCHKNPANSSVWGNAQDPANNATFPHTIANTPKQDCYACHNDITGKDFHNTTLIKPVLATVNCLSCHTTNMTMAPKEINQSVFETGSHRNRTCNDCHAGATTTNMNTYSISSNIPQNCTNCHTGTGIPGAPIVSEHNQFGQDVITTVNCTLCHSNSGMYLSNNGTNGTTTAIVHYLKDVTNLGTSPVGHNGTINTSNCIDCHNGPYTGVSSWGTPVNISTSTKRTHTETQTGQCDLCHKDGTVQSLALVDFHNSSIKLASTNDCISCHTQDQRGYPAINLTSFTKHSNVNTTGGLDTVTNDDCTTCHYNFNYTIMNQTGFTTPTRTCTDCHIDGSYQAPIISNHKPPKQPIVSGGNITTGAYCSTCHNNSINEYTYSMNASVSHYGTNASLVKPTVNQTARPVNGFMNSGDASSYNKECNNCHNPANTSYGNPQLITTPHTPTATCNQCHVDNGASDLHNVSLRIPGMGCLDCHTTNASRNRAPNLTNTYMVDSTNCDSTSCHGTSQDNGNAALDTLNEHNINRNERGFTGRGGYADTVYLNGSTSLTVAKGTIVTITSRVNDTSGSASRVGGAEYYYSGTDPGNGSGIPMNAVDGQFDAVNRNWEDVTATLDTSSLTAGTYIINVRGVDIGKQWSTTQTAILTVTAMGYINGTVTNGTSPVSGVYVSTIGDNYTTGPDGKYSLKVDANTYIVTATKQPTHYDNITSGIVVTQSNTTIFDIVLTEKPKGTITGTVGIA